MSRSVTPTVAPLPVPARMPWRPLLRWLLPLAVLLLWQIGASGPKEADAALPAPFAVLAQAWQLARSGELFQHLAASGLRVLGGFGIAVLLGCTLGFLAGASAWLARLSDGLMQALRLTPVVAAAPLLILWFGLGEGSKIAIIAGMGLFPMYLAALTAWRSVDPRLVEVLGVLQPGTAWRLWRFYLPATLPELLNGARYALIISWMSLVVAELIGTQTGIGHLAIAGNAHKNLELVFVAVLLFALCGKSTDALFTLATRRWTFWADTPDPRNARRRAA